MMKCDPRAFARCPYSAQCGDSPNNTAFYEGSECDYFNQKVLNTLPTNADLIRAMSDEELAKIVMCPNDVGLRDISCERDDDCDCYACILDWLRQPAGGRK